MAREKVILLHGLWMNRLAMQPLAWRLSGAGFDTTTLGYPSMRAELEKNAVRLAQTVRALRGERIHLLGHSMGGLIVLRYLQNTTDARIGRTVLLGSPVAGSQSGKRLDGDAWTRWMLGRSAAIWRAPPAWSLRGEVGMIAGSQAFGLARVVLPLAGENDGVVAVEETRLAGLADHVVLPVSHSGMLLSARVATQAAAFLHAGRFEKEAGAGASAAQ